MADQLNELAKMIVGAIGKVEIAIKGLSTYTKQITFGGASIVNSTGTVGLLGILGETTALISSIAEAANTAGVLDLESELNSVAAITAAVSGAIDSEMDISGSLAAASSTFDTILKDLTLMLAGISEPVSGSNAALRDVTDDISGLSEGRTTANGWLAEPV